MLAQNKIPAKKTKTILALQSEQNKQKTIEGPDDDLD